MEDCQYLLQRLKTTALLLIGFGLLWVATALTGIYHEFHGAKQELQRLNAQVSNFQTEVETVRKEVEKQNQLMREVSKRIGFGIE